jgi:enoyl-CoA hydratase
MTEALILTEIHGDGARRTALITLNRPKQLNALNDALMDQLGAALLAFDRDDGIGCIVITGNEKAFAAGADISAMARFSYMDVHHNALHHPQLGDAAAGAQARDRGGGGFALGGGCELAMMCDFIIAADTRASASPRSSSASSPAPAARSACRARWARPRPWTWC